MASIFRPVRREESGFTLVELLVVMLVIGLLAAIAIPAFLNQRDKATDSRAIQVARSAQTAMETCRTGSAEGSYVACTVAELRAIESSLPGDPELKVASLSDKGYTIIVQSKGLSSRTFRIRRNPGGTMTLYCTATGVGACRDDGTWY